MRSALVTLHGFPEYHPTNVTSSFTVESSLDLFLLLTVVILKYLLVNTFFLCIFTFLQFIKLLDSVQQSFAGWFRTRQSHVDRIDRFELRVFEFYVIEEQASRKIVVKLLWRTGMLGDLKLENPQVVPSLVGVIVVLRVVMTRAHALVRSPRW